MGNHGGWFKRFQSDAETFLKEGRVRSLVFSGGTYQIEVLDPVTESSEWPFFQFDEKGKLKDAFCSCEQEEGCAHLTAGLLKIYHGRSDPLHLRFRASFWNALAILLSDHCGFQASSLTKGSKNSYEFHNHIEFRLEAKNVKSAKFLSQLIENRERETPENSLKFSNLSQEEITRWREGRPSSVLRYELSFWSDLAKEWMMRQEEEIPYRIIFEETAEGLPLLLQVQWPNERLFLHLTINDLIFLIPTLSTVASPLLVFRETDEKIAGIEYDNQKKAFLIHYHEAPKPRLRRDKKQIPLKEGWVYSQGEGFYESEEESFEYHEIPEKSIALFLDKKQKLLSKHLKNAEIQTSRVPVSYEMAFDENWNWHFKAYLFEKGDLQMPTSAFFGKWAYIEKKGFYPVEGALFEKAEEVLSSRQVSNFINHHRIWLNSQEGFTTHLASVETQLSYQMTPDGHLRFLGKLHTHEENIETKDFGDWIYFQWLGFFSKKYARLGVAVVPGMEIPSDNISTFLKTHREELENIPNFFTIVQPLEKRGLRVELLSQNSIQITPEWELLPEYKDRKVHFFGDYLFIEGEGFCELPARMRLSEVYQEPFVVYGDKIPHFLEHELEKLKPWITTLDPRLEKPHQCILEVHYLARNPQGGLKGQFFYRTERGKVAASEILDAMQKKKNYLFTEAGCLDLQEERFQWLRRIKTPPLEGSLSLELPTVDFLRLDAVEGLQIPNESSPTLEITRSLLHELREFIVAEKPVPEELKSDLRVYQQTGLYWLWFLYKNGLSGLLCDEMGLGKTHQAMALIASILSLKEKNKRFLVVCPTSVIYHWQDKLEAFLPSLKVHTFHGFRRTLKGLPKEGVLLTSYGILRVEKEKLKEIPFEVAIYDEIQNAKNPHSRIHNALLSVQARMRVGLTGTPIENNLRELKALFDAVLPGLMPGEARFKEVFMNPIEKEGNEEKKVLLSQMIRPFILRRRKKEVLQELPEKTIDRSFCDLSPVQTKLYQDVLAKSRETVLADLEKGESPIPYVHIFSILSNLKQICDHPALSLKDPKNYKKYESGKWDLFVELLEEARESQQKVVVFSQYLLMLDIIESYLEEKKWGYAQIRGDTQNRREELHRFQNDPNCVVFIGTLQAAGVGIDLTAASVVILYDRWWNAARENQAIDRVHRIGQKWGVQVYKLITKGTIEEKIDLLIEKKGRLMEEVVLSDDQSQLKTFTREELMDLLSLSPQEFNGS